MANVYRNKREELIDSHNSTDYVQGIKDAEYYLKLELRTHLTPLLNAIDTLDAVINDKKGYDALKKVILKKNMIQLMYEEIDNIANLRL